MIINKNTKSGNKKFLVDKKQSYYSYTRLTKSPVISLILDKWHNDLLIIFEYECNMNM